MASVSSVLFDLDGVLVHSYDAWYAVVREGAERWGFGPVSPERFAKSWGQGIRADADTLFPGKSISELEAFYDEAFPRHLDAVKADPQAAPVFAELRRRGIRIAVITNTPGPLAREVLRRAGLDPDAVVGGTDVPREKPAPDMVRRACELLGVRPADAIVVGDSRFDREAASAAGVRFIGLRIPGDATMATLGELTRMLPGASPPA